MSQWEPSSSPPLTFCFLFKPGFLADRPDLSSDSTKHLVMSPRWGSTPRLTDRLTIGHNVTLADYFACWFLAELISSTLKMEAICSSETSVDTQRTAQRNIPDDILHNTASSGRSFWMYEDPGSFTLPIAPIGMLRTPIPVYIHTTFSTLSLLSLLLLWLTVLPWRCRPHVPPKCLYTSTRPHGIKSQKITLFIVVTTTTASNLTRYSWTINCFFFRCIWNALSHTSQYTRNIYIYSPVVTSGLVSLHFKLVSNTPNYYVFGLYPSSGILKTREHNVSETGSVSVLRWGGKAPTQLGTLERAE
jgi:hypothetical protein